MTFNTFTPQIVNVRIFNEETDEYGQKRKGFYTDRPVEGILALYNQSPNQSIVYNNCEVILITNDTSITDENELIIDGESYLVLHVIPSRRKRQVLLKKKG